MELIAAQYRGRARVLQAKLFVLKKWDVIRINDMACQMKLTFLLLCLFDAL
ncbi:MAG: hypothetical protein II073_06860 [Lachnospiraceae bacterium]|nr:hypothetical protein [Lachnospiraceae bacterium]